MEDNEIIESSEELIEYEPEIPSYSDSEAYYPSGDYLNFPDTVVGENFAKNFLDFSADFYYLQNVASPSDATMALMQTRNFAKLQAYEALQTRLVVTIFALSFMIVTLAQFFNRKFKGVT